MVSTFTPNIQWEEPARGDDVGTWDTPVNGNGTLIDLVVGAINTIGLNNSNVVLSAAQFRSKQITFNSTLTGSVTITFPTSFTKSYEVQHLCTGSSTFTITLATTATGGQVICCPPGEIIDCVNDGVNLKYKNFARIGSYWDYAGSSVPSWVAGCTVAPYLNCDGTTFSAGTFPALAVILGSTTLPDGRGRSRIALNGGTGRVTSSQGGVDGNTAYAVGGSQSTVIGTSNLPAYTPSGSLSLSGIVGTGTAGPVAFSGANTIPTGAAANNGTFTGTPQGGVSAAFSNMQPSYVGGLTLIRSA